MSMYFRVFTPLSEKELKEALLFGDTIFSYRTLEELKETHGEDCPYTEIDYEEDRFNELFMN